MDFHKQHCRNCAYFKPSRKGIPGSSCLRFPPHSNKFQDPCIPEHAYPLVKANTPACGEFKLKEPKRKKRNLLDLVRDYKIRNNL